MVPSRSWFPQSLPARAEWFQNFATNFATVAIQLGFTNADIQSVNNDNAMIQFLADADTQKDAWGASVTQFIRIITQGNIGEPTPTFSAPPNLSNPGSSETGIFERLNKLRSKIFLANGYTDEIGALLKILPKSSDSVVPAQVKLTLQGFPATSNAVFSAVVGNRENSDAWDVYVLRKGANSWEFVGRYNGKSADVQVTLTTPGQPEQLQVRVQGRKNNQNYGQPSDAIELTLNP